MEQWRAHESIVTNRLCPPPLRQRSPAPDKTGWLNVKLGTRPKGGSLPRACASRQYRVKHHMQPAFEWEAGRAQFDLARRRLRLLRPAG